MVSRPMYWEPSRSSALRQQLGAGCPFITCQPPQCSTLPITSSSRFVELIIPYRLLLKIRAELCEGWALQIIYEDDTLEASPLGLSGKRMAKSSRYIALMDYAMPCASGGYPQSKWVAEKVLLLARKHGLPVSLYRPGYGIQYMTIA